MTIAGTGGAVVGGVVVTAMVGVAVAGLVVVGRGDAEEVDWSVGGGVETNSVTPAVGAPVVFVEVGDSIGSVSDIVGEIVDGDSVCVDLACLRVITNSQCLETSVCKLCRLVHPL